MKKHTLSTAIAAVLLTALPALCLAQSSATASQKKSTPSSSAAAQPAKAAKPSTHATTGVVKSIDDNTLVIGRAKHNQDMTFQLNSTTEKSGDIKVGSTVGVRYHTEAQQNIATAVTVEHAKQSSNAHHKD